MAASFFKLIRTITIFKLIRTITIILCSTWLHAFTIQCLWTWFIIPIFSLPTLTLSAAYGIWIIGMYFLYIPSSLTIYEALQSFEKYSKEIGKDEFNNKLLNINVTLWICKPILTLLSGWIVVKFFMG